MHDQQRTSTGHRVFVYGTLMPGRSNQAVAERAGLRGYDAAEVHGFRLYHLEPEGYPAVVRGPGVVHGYVLELTGSLEELDALEGVALDPPLYHRVRCVPHGHGPAWIYLYARSDRLSELGCTWLPEGRWPPKSAFDS